MFKNKVLVAMSGGVDSSVVVAKMLEQGYLVEGITIDFGRFCDDSLVVDAKKVAEQFNIKHHILNLEERFEEKVVKYFADEYIKGNTPNPCVKCNREIKFFELLEFRKKIDADFLVTGHYANIINNNGSYCLEKGSDPKKDQSYFLGQLKYEYLQFIKFPLGNMKKTEVREYAKNIGLIVAEKFDSQDICFTKGKDYKTIIKNYYTPKSGDIIHTNGKKLGEHNGTINYTIGQRRGLGIGYTEPLFVIDIDTEKNLVYVGSESELLGKKVNIEKVSLLDLNLEFEKVYEFDVKLRSTNNSDRAKIVFHKDNTGEVELLKPSRNITRSQLCCIYDGNRVTGSGYIF